MIMEGIRKKKRSYSDGGSVLAFAWGNTKETSKLQ
jgi:hypothetical protein